MYHYKYNEWLDKVEIGIHCPIPSPHPATTVTGSENFDSRPTHITPRLSEFGLIQAIHISLALPMYHYNNYNEWSDKVEIGIHCPIPSPYPATTVTGSANIYSRLLLISNPG
eukprot:scaffold5623_cov74-Cyclotella_meneghiniana.AAC.1